MTPSEIAEKIRSKFAGEILEAKMDGVPDPFLKVKTESLCDIAAFCRDDAELHFDYLMCLSGVDYGKGTFGAVYNLSSILKHHKITLKVEVPRDAPQVPSVATVWPTANWHEREAFDLFGILFTGHPDLRRILLPNDWEGHPLRKDYKVPEFYQGMKVPY